MKLKRREIRPDENWPKAGVFFDVKRGSFELDAKMLKRAELTDDAFEIRRAFAINIPDGAQVSRREKIPGGGLLIHWRRVRVFGLFKRDARRADFRAVDLHAEDFARVPHEFGGEVGIAVDATLGLAHREVDQRSESAREYDAAFAREPAHRSFEFRVLVEDGIELSAALDAAPDDFTLR